MKGTGGGGILMRFMNILRLECGVQLQRPWGTGHAKRSPACIRRTARAETNSRAKRESRAEQRVVDMEN